MHTLLITRDVAFLFIYLCIKTKTKGSLNIKLLPAVLYMNPDHQTAHNDARAAEIND